jgi:hypothetical protein
MVRAASSAIRASRCKSAPVTRRPRLLAPRPDMLAAHLLEPEPRPDMLAACLLAIRSPPACSASGHTILKPEPTWVMMASDIPVREPLGGKPYVYWGRHRRPPVEREADAPSRCVERLKRVLSEGP